VAFNLDKHFRKAGAHGKQCLSMCMGFGCNAVGVIGCRIIDSPRERNIAILTNNFVPCNGRFPALITIGTLFIGAGVLNGILGSLISALVLTAIVALGIVTTFLVSKFLSSTVLKGEKSSFSLELPPYRRPQILKIITRSVLDRTLFVLGRAVTVAVPAGLLIWLLANIKIADVSLIIYFSNILSPLGWLMGLDGVILCAFILGFPANEIVIPILIMIYSATGQLTDFESLESLKTLLTENGWTIITAVNMLLFTLFHFPCATTFLTIKHETKDKKLTLLSMLIPTALGIAVCTVINLTSKIFGM
jgi:ferrous iron transport protein B